jgi:hypothetical protein
MWILSSAVVVVVVASVVTSSLRCCTSTERLDLASSELSQGGGSGGGCGVGRSRGGRWLKVGRWERNSATSTGLYHISQIVNVVGKLGHEKRFDGVWEAVEQDGQISSVVALIQN